MKISAPSFLHHQSLSGWATYELKEKINFWDIWRSSCSNYHKGTQDWEFFWLRFWNLRYFFVSYVKILRFYRKFFLIGPLLGEVRFFHVVLGLCRMKINVELGKKFFFSSSIMDPKYDPILVFWKFNQLNAPGTTLCVDLGSKCQILCLLVWD